MEQIIGVQIGVLVSLFGIAAMLSLAETSLIGMSRLKIIAHIRNEHPKAKYLKAWIDDPNKLLATLSILINAVAISASTIGAFLSLRLAEIWGLNASLTATGMAVLITFIIIIFGEISPKIFAIHNTEKMGLRLIKPIVILYKLIKPITAFFVKISNITVRLFGGRPSSSIPIISSKDISTVIDVGHEEGFLSSQEKQMMDNILEIREMEVRHAMIPRTEIMALNVDWDMDKILDLVIEEGYTRMPVFKDDVDHITGIIYVKDMLSMIKNRSLIIFEALIRTPHFVPETKSINELFKEFKQGRFHMAVVVDEFGGTAGLITLEDILEEIVGEIQDEYDMEIKEVEQVSSGVYVVKGMAEIDKLNDRYGFDIPEEDDINTIGGFLTDIFNRVPQDGESMKFGSLNFTIVKSDARKIIKVKVEILPDAAATEKEPN